MQLVERHIIKPNHKYFSECDKLCLFSKNIYNAANYLYRQNYFKGISTSAIDVYHQLKTTNDYKVLPAKVAQNTLRLVLRNWTSYYAALKAYDNEPNKFKGKPKIPHYKGDRNNQREDGRYIVGYNNQAISKKLLKKNIVNPSGSNIYLPTKVKKVDEVRILPKAGYYVIEVVYTNICSKAVLPQERIASCDLGLNNLATLTYNVPGIKPIIFDGRAIKAANQYANKKNTFYQSKLNNSQYSSKRIKKLWAKRNLKVDYYLHNTSRAIINELVNNKIGTLVIGWNEEFKDSINQEQGNNHKFVLIPHKRLISQLTYKGKLAGIEVVTINEAYTSKCSALDHEPIKKHNDYLGKRVKRGMFITAKGLLINADINGSLNIGRLYNQKVAGNARSFASAQDSLGSAHPVEGVVVHPMRVKPYKENRRHICR